MAPGGPHARLRRLARSRSGNVAIVAAASLPLLVGVLALGVDWSYLGYQKRKAQADTDLAAISAAAALADPAQALRHYAADNGLDVTVVDEAVAAAAPASDTMTYVLGHYEPAPDIAHEKRFVPGALPANAVRVTLHRKADLGFARAFMAPPEITTVATAGRDAEAAFSIGSRLASLKGGLLNAVLGGLLGTSLDLEVMDYRALIDADVDAFGFLRATATRLHLSGATYDDVLASRLSIGTMLSALAETNGVSATARLALRRLSQAAAGSHETVDLARLLNLGDAGRDPVGSAGLSAMVGVLDLISAAAAVADGDHQVAIDLGAGLPGLAKLSVTLFIGEPPQGSAWFAVGGAGALVRTAQTRLRIDATVGGGGLLSALQIHLPLYLQVAYGEAALADIRCAGGSADSAAVDVDARPGVAEAWIGDGPTDLAQVTSRTLFKPARLVDARLVRVDGYAHANTTNSEAMALRFSGGDIREGRVQTVSTRQTISTLLSSLVGDLDLKADVLGLPLATPALVERALATTLAGATQPLDAALSNILLALGIRIGEADIRVTGVDCGRPVLVQ